MNSARRDQEVPLDLSVKHGSNNGKNGTATNAAGEGRHSRKRRRSVIAFETNEIDTNNDNRRYNSDSVLQRWNQYQEQHPCQPKRMKKQQSVPIMDAVAAERSEINNNNNNRRYNSDSVLQRWNQYLHQLPRQPKQMKKQQSVPMIDAGAFERSEINNNNTNRRYNSDSVLQRRNKYLQQHPRQPKRIKKQQSVQDQSVPIRTDVVYSSIVTEEASTTARQQQSLSQQVSINCDILIDDHFRRSLGNKKFRELFPLC